MQNISVNCFEIGQNGSRARALYDEAFLLAHDCSANTSHTDNPKNYEMTIRVTRDVRKGEAITLSYAYTLQVLLKFSNFLVLIFLLFSLCVDVKVFILKFNVSFCRGHSKEESIFRKGNSSGVNVNVVPIQQVKLQLNLLQNISSLSWNSHTELGTYSSAIQCPKCRGGLILSTDSLEQNAPWKCGACAYIVTGKSMLLLVDTVFKELDSINSNDVVGFEEFLGKLSSAN